MGPPGAFGLLLGTGVESHVVGRDPQPQVQQGESLIEREYGLGSQIPALLPLDSGFELLFKPKLPLQ